MFEAFDVAFRRSKSDMSVRILAELGLSTGLVQHHELCGVGGQLYTRCLVRPQAGSQCMSDYPRKTQDLDKKRRRKDAALTLSFSVPAKYIHGQLLYIERSPLCRRCTFVSACGRRCMPR